MKRKGVCPNPACVEQVRAWLIEVARRGGMTTYEGTAVKAPACDAHARRYTRLHPNLYEVSRSEHEQGRPLLTAVVVRKDGRVGDGFYRMARCVGKHEGTDDLAFWLAEVRRVHDYWAAASQNSGTR